MSQAWCCVCNPPLTPTLGGSGGHSGEAQDAQPFASSDLSSLETTVGTSAEKRPRGLFTLPCFLEGPLHRLAGGTSEFYSKTIEPSQKSGKNGMTI